MSILDNEGPDPQGLFNTPPRHRAAFTNDEHTRERVAVAIFLAKNGPKAKWDTFPRGYQDGYRLMAEAAIAELIRHPEPQATV